MENTKSSHLLMLLSSFFVATSFIVGGHITNSIDPLVLCFVRFSLASVVLGLFLSQGAGLQPSWSLFFRSAMISLTMVIFFWTMFVALRFTTPLNTAVIFAMTPLLASIYSLILGYEKWQPKRFFALIYGGVGALWVVFQGSATTFLEMSWNKGDLIFLGGCVVMAFYAPAIKKMGRGEDSLLMTFWVLFSGALWLLCFSLPLLFSYSWSTVPMASWWWVVYLVFFTTIVTIYCNQFAVPKIGPVRVAAYSYLYPAIVLLLNIILGKDLPSAQVLPGTVIVVSAMYFIGRAEQTKKS